MSRNQPAGVEPRRRPATPPPGFCDQRAKRQVTTDQPSPDTFDWAGLVARTLHPIEVQIIEAMQWLDQPLSAGDLAQLFDEAVPWPVLCRHFRRLTKLEAIELAEPATERNISSVTYRLARPSRP